MTMRFTYPKPRPDLTIEHGESVKLGNCYHRYPITVTSLSRLSKETIIGLERLGLLGFGQGFSIKSQCDGKEEYSLDVDAPCVATVGAYTSTPAIDPRTKQLKPPHNYKYFQYIVERTVDSGG